MTVEKIFSDDEITPKFDQFGPLKKIIKQNLYISLGIALIIFVIDGLGAALLALILVLPILSIPRFIILNFKTALSKGKGHYDQVHNYFKELALKNGIEISYEAPGIIIDRKAKKVVFTIDPEQEGKIVICDFSDIKKWYTHEATVTNENYKVHQSGRITGGETLATFNGVRVEINDPDQPLYGFWTSGEDDSNRWVARLSSLING